jgi:hypothetical protein
VIGVGKAFAQFAIENEVAQALTGGEVVHGLRKGETERRRGGGEGLAVLARARRSWACEQFRWAQITETLLNCDLRVAVRYRVPR